MKLKRTGSRWDRIQRININDNWDEIEKTYSPLLNIGKDAEIILKEALGINAEAKRVNDENKSVQHQINTFIADSGTSPTELVQARIDAEGNEFPVVKDRLDTNDFRVQNKSNISKQIGDAVGEWWIEPREISQSTPYPRTVSGAVSSSGKIVVIEYNHATGKESRYEIAQATVDDHNVPSVFVRDGSRPVVAWTNHNTDKFLRFKVGSRNGDIGSLVNAKEVAVDVSNVTSYTQLHHIKHLSSNEIDVYFMLYRAGNAMWRIYQFNVDKKTGNMYSEHTTGRTFVTSPGRQCYISSADAHAEGNQVIRFAWGYNPAQPVHAVYYIELDVVTGNITSPIDPDLNANYYTNAGLPIDDASITPMLEEPSEGMSRRLFYTRPGPDAPAVAYAEWTIGDEDNAVYRVSEIEQDVDRGGLQTNSGYISTPGDASLNHADGIEVKVVAQFTGVPDKDAELARRYDSSINSIFTLRLTPQRELRMGVTQEHNNIPYFSSAIPGNWDDVMGYGMRIDVNAWKLYPLYSPDGESWITLTGIDMTETRPYKLNASAPFIVPTSLPENFTTPHMVYSATLKSLDGTLLAGFEDVETEWGGSSTTDASGNVWTLSGDATIKASVTNVVGITTNEFGVSGTRIGHTAAANYVAGMAFENPSYDKSVVTAHSDGTQETIKKWWFNGSEYMDEVLLETATQDGRLIRPYIPHNNNAIPVTLTKMTNYNGYQDYYGDQITT